MPVDVVLTFTNPNDVNIEQYIPGPYFGGWEVVEEAGRASSVEEAERLLQAAYQGPDSLGVGVKWTLEWVPSTHYKIHTSSPVSPLDGEEFTSEEEATAALLEAEGIDPDEADWRLVDSAVELPDGRTVTSWRAYWYASVDAAEEDLDLTLAPANASAGMGLQTTTFGRPRGPGPDPEDLSA